MHASRTTVGAIRRPSPSGDFFVNWADFPSVVAGSEGTLFAHWLQRRAGGKYATT
jgi:hypothetical protein